MSDSDEASFEIHAELDLESHVYHVTFVMGDEKVELTEAMARRWVDCVVAALTSAEYEAAMVRQMTALGLQRASIGSLIAEFHKRVPVPELRLLGLSVVGGVNVDGEPVVQMFKDGVNLGQMSPADARTQVAGVLESMAIAARDNVFLQLLTESDRVPFGKATQMVATVGMYREIS